MHSTTPRDCSFLFVSQILSIFLQVEKHMCIGLWEGEDRGALEHGGIDSPGGFHSDKISPLRSTGHTLLI